MEIRPGMKFASTVSEAQFVVIRGASDVELTHAGAPVTTDLSAAPSGAGAEGAVLVGKRYSDDSGELELLCVKAGAGELAVAGQVLTVKAAKALPASD